MSSRALIESQSPKERGFICRILWISIGVERRSNDHHCCIIGFVQKASRMRCLTKIVGKPPVRLGRPSEGILPLIFHFFFKWIWSKTVLKFSASTLSWLSEDFLLWDRVLHFDGILETFWPPSTVHMTKSNLQPTK